MIVTVILTALPAILGYLLGSIPVGLAIARLRGIEDPRRGGTGTAGATNIALQAGVPAGVAVFTLDLAKGAVASLLGAAIAGPPGAAVAALGAIAGQILPVFAGFRGGKGVATTLGAYLGLAPLFAVSGLVLWGVLAFGVLRRFIPATLVTLVVLAIAAALTAPGALAGFASGAAALGFWSHRRDLEAWRDGRIPTVAQTLRDNRQRK